jgi:dTDP-4-dehydrorhamnose reductase
MKILVLGASGMLGHTVLRRLHGAGGHEVFGTARDPRVRARFPTDLAERILPAGDFGQTDAVAAAVAEVSPDLIVNCVGVIKQLASAKDPLHTIPLNSLLPHRLAVLARLGGARLIHISTDCVFSGRKGGYTEADTPDADDLYGLSKRLGEVGGPGAITLRTSIIGRELGSKAGLVEWFLSQTGEVRGFTRAIFSGVTAQELARVIDEVVLPRPELEGLYQVAAQPISKHDLLVLLKARYGVPTVIRPDESLVIDRSLKADRFNAATGYAPPSWPEMIAQMDTPLD